MGKTAFLFAGQGAQYPGMGKELYGASPAAKEAFDLAERLRPGTLAQCFEGTKEVLSQTVNTQPCLFAVDLAAAAALKEAGVRADFAAGFSLGEIPALAFGGYLRRDDAFQFVIRRGEAMDACAKAAPGAMLAVIGSDEETVEGLCAAFSGCYPVNYNAPAQTVVALRQEDAASFITGAKNAGARALRLNVSGAFHSPYMDGAFELLKDEFSELPLREGNIPVFSNVTATPYAGKELLFEQVHAPVRWRQTMENLAGQGVDTFVEVGAGTTLTGLCKKILPEAVICNVQDAASLEKTWNILKVK